jgi:hypothetical protein
VHEVLRSPGQPLDAASRALVETRFRHDFSQVRVHTGTRAAESARQVGALAYTVGNNLVFGSGQYAPGTENGRHLLSHELAHVIQQSQADTNVTGLNINEPDDKYEREAKALSARVMAGDHPGAVPKPVRGTAAGLMRKADETLVPTGLPCDVTDAEPGTEEGTNLSRIEVNTANLTKHHKEQITEFFKQWAAAGSKDFVFVEGYASVDGPADYKQRQELNWRLSCDRADAAEA